MAISNKQQLNRYTIGCGDFSKALEYLKASKNYQPNTIIYEALLFAGIVTYFKPFSENERSNLTDVTSKISIEELMNLSDSENKLHERCKTLRNKALAHSEFSFNPTRVDGSGIIASKPFSLLSPPFDVDGLIALLEKLYFICDNKRADYILHPPQNAN